MKTSLILLFAGLSAITLLSTSCQESDAAAAPAQKIPENGAQFKKGEGLSLTDDMKKAIGLDVTEVGEEEIASSFSCELTVTGSSEARGAVSSKDATLLKPGMEITLHAGGNTAIPGKIHAVEKVPFGLPGDLEVTVTAEGSLPSGSLRGTVQIPAAGSVTAVPVSAVLKTAEGSFVYTVNDSFYIRTPVTTGAENEKFVEITDGLYAGDEIVTTPVMSLWMAELQVLRGGKACTCGH